MKIEIADRWVFASEILFAAVVLLLALARVISYDMGIAAILFSFSPALFPAMIENYQKKIGWNRHSTLITFQGEVVLGVIFYVLGLYLSVVITALLTAAWGILLVQSFKYYQGGG
jgi:hypothetical protein